MLAKDIIVDTIPPIKPNESGEKALVWMDEFKVIHLPVVRGTEYLGLVTDDLIYDQNNPSIALEEMKVSFNRPFVYADTHLLDIMRLVAQQNLSIIPVLDKEENYLGSITLSKLVESFTQTASIITPGAVVVLEMNKIDYSLAKLAQIAEANQCLVLGAFVTSELDSKKIEVTLKLNREEIGGLLHAFNRYDYVVKSFHTHNQIANTVRENYEALINYLNI